jgi:acyl carrier protein
MTEPEIYRQLTTIFRDIFDDDTLALTPQTTAHDIEEWDSFNHINIVVAAETRFGVKFATSEVESCENVGELVRLIEHKLSRTDVASA